ncbi:hypothetical protein M413DRAFT_445558 [Hebeloma cylindrosporum]|uniref:Uncharacterized protein n=1 Tax=Hebeloma cylindrosporum TaxID=76867 RepID=A0A0C3CBJ2_HEBCY|nr:hypothetical protein M413DRAFT_445558 [Hebeloma cylindrosporum h7]
MTYGKAIHNVPKYVRFDSAFEFDMAVPMWSTYQGGRTRKTKPPHVPQTITFHFLRQGRRFYQLTLSFIWQLTWAMCMNHCLERGKIDLPCENSALR